MINIKKITEFRPFFFLLLLGVFALGAIFWRTFSPVRAEKCADYLWLNHQLRCQDKPVIDKAAYTAFKNKLVRDIESWKKEGLINDIAVYFRDLQNGPYFGINADAQFIPASLLKVPVMITYFKLAEDDPELLNRELIYNSDSRENEFVQNLSSQETLELGRPYKINEIIYKMVVYSDNRSLFVLTNYFREISPEKSPLLQTYKDLGIPIYDGSEDEFMSARIYSSIFRIIYNASYLSKENSNRALQYLSESKFKTGLSSGLPVNIQIAHKFGERDLREGPDQLHDCGIVYYPQNPYLLCVMTKGETFDGMLRVVQGVSRTIYKEVKSREN